MGVADAYERSAEFLDVMIAPAWAALGPALARALRGVTGPVVDVGAGGGHGTRVIADAVPGAPIVAVEPSPGLRAALLARVCEDAGLRDRVTVLPERLFGPPPPDRPDDPTLPDRLGAVVLMNVIGHFDAAARDRLWRLLADRLVPGGRAVLNLPPPAQPVAVPLTRFCDIRAGRRRYEGWGRAEPAGPGLVTWHMTYRTFDADRPVGEVTASYDWWVLDQKRLEAETGEHGLLASGTGPVELGMYVIQRAAG
ncbi:class I SAM-dependent methyltransferase [Nonomuraea sp. PA05]|nr:class I SAM-dependent methyltransferase [Nonomuraea sp. PA05]